MNRNELVREVAERTNKPIREVDESLTAILDVIRQKMAAGEKVDLRGFASFEVSKTEASAGRNPRTGEAITIPAQTRPRCRFFPGFKRALNP